MNRRQAITSLACLGVSATAQTTLLVGKLRAAPAVAVDWLARYQAAYPRNENQGPTGVCVHSMANVGMHAVALNIQGVPSPLLSAGYGYLADTHDRTFSVGTWPSAAARQRESGVCTDALYSQEYLIAHWQNNFPYPPEFLPQPPCYADAPNHRLTRWTYLAGGTPYGTPPDMALIRQLLLAGYPVPFNLGRHAGCLLYVEPDGYWHYGYDSLLAGVNAYGLGPGVRPYSASMLYADGWEWCVYQEVSSGPAPPVSQQPLIDLIRADAAALTLPLTQEQIDKLRDHVGQLRIGP